MISDVDGIYTNQFNVENPHYDSLSLKNLNEEHQSYKTVTLVYNLTPDALLNSGWSSIALGGFIIGQSSLPENVPGFEELEGHSTGIWNGRTGTNTGITVNNGIVQMNTSFFSRFSDKLKHENGTWVSPDYWRDGDILGPATGPTSFIMGNHLVVMKMSLQDYTSTHNHRLRVEVWYDDFTQVLKGTSLNLFEVALSKTNDELNLRIEMDGDVLNLQTQVKKYEGGELVDSIVEKDINMGVGIYTDLEMDSEEILRPILRRSGDGWIYASAGSNSLGRKRRHSKLPEMGREGINTVSYVSDNEGEKIYINGGVVLSRDIDDSDTTAAFNRGLTGLVLSVKAGAGGVYGTDGPDYNLVLQARARLTGIKWYKEALTADEMFGAYYEYLSDSEKVKYCDDKYEGQINVLKEEADGLQNQIGVIEQEHGYLVDELRSKIDTVKRQRDFVAGSSISKKEGEISVLDADSYNASRRASYLAKRNKTIKARNYRLTILLIILSVVLILSLLIKYGKETKLGGWLSSRWSEARARYEYHGPTAELGSWSN
tara:strand:+ start:8873 stop:10501 length:1629 start_codon:yes stop_codon:yes gene_type:complete